MRRVNNVIFFLRLTNQHKSFVSHLLTSFAHLGWQMVSIGVDELANFTFWRKSIFLVVVSSIHELNILNQLQAKYHQSKITFLEITSFKNYQQSKNIYCANSIVTPISVREVMDIINSKQIIRTNEAI